MRPLGIEDIDLHDDPAGETENHRHGRGRVDEDNIEDRAEHELAGGKLEKSWPVERAFGTRGLCQFFRRVDEEGPAGEEGSEDQRVVGTMHTPRAEEGKVESPNHKAQDEKSAIGSEIGARETRTQAMPPRLRMSHAIVSCMETLLTERFHAGKFAATVRATGHLAREVLEEC